MGRTSGLASREESSTELRLGLHSLARELSFFPHRWGCWVAESNLYHYLFLFKCDFYGKQLHEWPSCTCVMYTNMADRKPAHVTATPIADGLYSSECLVRLGLTLPKSGGLGIYHRYTAFVTRVLIACNEYHQNVIGQKRKVRLMNNSSMPTSRERSVVQSYKGYTGVLIMRYIRHRVLHLIYSKELHHSWWALQLDRYRSTIVLQTEAYFIPGCLFPIAFHVFLFLRRETLVRQTMLTIKRKSSITLSLVTVCFRVVSAWPSCVNSHLNAAIWLVCNFLQLSRKRYRGVIYNPPVLGSYRVRPRLTSKWPRQSWRASGGLGFTYAL